MPSGSIHTRYHTYPYFKKDGENPQKWFSKFDIFPVEGIEMNNPNLAENWKKTSNDNVPTYTFTINK